MPFFFFIPNKTTATTKIQLNSNFYSVIFGFDNLEKGQIESNCKWYLKMQKNNKKKQGSQKVYERKTFKLKSSSIYKLINIHIKWDTDWYSEYENHPMNLKYSGKKGNTDTHTYNIQGTIEESSLNFPLCYFGLFFFSNILLKFTIYHLYIHFAV